MSQIEEFVYARRYDAFVVCAPADEGKLQLIMDGLHKWRLSAIWDSRVNQAICNLPLEEIANVVLKKWKGDTLLILWSRHTRGCLSLGQLVAYAQLRRGTNVLVASLDGSEPFDTLQSFQRVDLQGWTADGSYESVGLHGPRLASPGARPRPPVPRTQFNELTELVSTHRSRGADAIVQEVAARRVDSTPALPELQPVRLGVSGPRVCNPGGEFSAVFACYVDAAKGAVRQALEELGDPEDRIALDLTPTSAARWTVGAPVTVRLSGQHLTVSPPQQVFEFNGSHNIAAFAVRVAPAIPSTAVLMCFEVFVDGVPTAFVPLRLRIAAGSADAVANRADISVPTSAFASYASKDLDEVAGRLSSLTRWQPGLDIFMDCLDLVPNEAFKPALAQQIKERDYFLLFWSRHAAESRWVRWELETALAAKGRSRFEKILPMPLEDQAIAPMPPEFGDLHQRDRFMVAAYGLDRIRQELAQVRS